MFLESCDKQPSTTSVPDAEVSARRCHAWPRRSEARGNNRSFFAYITLQFSVTLIET